MKVTMELTVEQVAVLGAALGLTMSDDIAIQTGMTVDDTLAVKLDTMQLLHRMLEANADV